MKSWRTTELELEPHAPQILASTDAARVIALMVPAGESLDEHQVHETAWVLVLAGEVEIETATGARVRGGSGLLFEFPRDERHAVHALSDTRLLLLLTPWPGAGHPGAMTLDEKANVRGAARARRASLERGNSSS